MRARDKRIEDGTCQPECSDGEEIVIGWTCEDCGKRHFYDDYLDELGLL